MPLQPGNSRTAISNNISELTHHGSRKRNHDQIVAIALANADRHPHAASGGLPGGIGKVAPFHLMKEPAVKPPAEHLMSPSQGTPWWTRSEARLGEKPPSGIGGGHMASGGMSMSTDSPWWERADARIADQPFNGGLIGGSGAGRTDQIPLSVASSSHVIPADVVSGMGQGHTLAGANILDMALKSGPYGTNLPRSIHGSGPPHAPSASIAEAEGRPTALESSMMLAKGGDTKSRVSILAAAGEYVVPPHQVRELGERMIAAGKDKGDPTEAGHRYLDSLIKRVRDFNIKWLKTAPPPKK